MTKQPWIVLTTAVAFAAAGAGIYLWQSQPDEDPPTQPAAADPVAISVPDAPDELTIGVVVTLSSSPGQGTEWKYAAEGAQVAVERMSMGGVEVQLRTVDDKGTKAGSRQAVEKLAKQGVSGVVVASQGSHLRGAVVAAQDTGVPLLLPYEPDQDLLGKHLTWSTGPTNETIGEMLGDAMEAAELTRPLLIDGGQAPEGVKPAKKLSFASGGDVDELMKQVQKKIKKKKGDKKDPIDGIVISGPATQQAAIVQALQGAKIDLPVYLTPEATSPEFTAALVDAGGSLSTSLSSVGPDWSDAAALRSDASGAAMSSFLEAVRMQARNDEAMSLMGDQSFSTVAGSADAQSHDAVVALVRAAAAAESGTAADVAAAITELKLDHTAGLVGPALDFTTTAALDAEAVVALQSSNQDLGLRPNNADPRLIWFAEPTTE